MDNSAVRKLTYVVLQPTQFCNINCSYCYLPSRNIKGVMSFSLLKTTIKKILHSKQYVSSNLTFLWHAGEPLIAGVSFYEEVIRLCDKYNVYGHHISHQIQTNATLIDDDWCIFFKNNNFHVGVSLDGPQYIHDMYRKSRSGNGTFEQTIKGIDLLKKHNIDVGIIAVLTRQSLAFADEIYTFFKEQSLHSVAFNIEEVEVYNITSSFSSGIIGEIIPEYRAFFKRLYHLIKKDEYKFKIREFDKISSIILKKRNDPSFIYEPLEVNPFAMLTIGIDGTVYAFSPEFAGAKSLVYDDFSCGNIKENSISQIRNTILNSKLRRDVYNSVSACETNCDYFTYCGGAFLSNKYSENGSLADINTRSCTLHSKTVIDEFLESAFDDS